MLEPAPKGAETMAGVLELGALSCQNQYLAMQEPAKTSTGTDEWACWNGAPVMLQSSLAK